MRRPCTAALAALALALGACGGDEDTPPAAKVAAPRCTPTGAASATTSIEPKWSAGDTRSITISKTREESGEEPSESSATAGVRVLSAGRDGSRLEWTSTDLVLPDDQVPGDARERLKEVAKDFKVLYRTDSRGAYERKLNVPEIRQRLTQVLDLLAEDPAAADAVQRTRSIILSDPFIQTSAVKEISVLHSAYGLKLREAKPQPVTQRIANPFGGEALTATGTVELVDARDSAGCAIVELDAKPSRAALSKSLADTFGDQASDAPTAARRAGLRVENTSRFAYDPGTGWIVRGDFVQTVTISGKTRSDITVITTRG